MSNFQANPSGAGPFPGLIVIQEFWGVDAHIKDVTRRLAAEGFVALAVDLYDGRIAKDPTEARQMMQALDQQATLEKLNAGVASLKANPQTGGRVSVIGFCMGGFWALGLAAQNKDIRAACAFYGRVPPDAAIEKITAPVLYVYAGKDHHIPISEPHRLRDAVQAKGGSVEVKVYPDADHAFMNDTRKEVYKADDAKDAWTRAASFLKKHS
jgi:carboxymethylenebutenolidase